jgi:hypothetical protein|tara:strand:- start:1714 stop:2190 length:477 start_codon:yes stop_codon:yes gene_type:complete
MRLELYRFSSQNESTLGILYIVNDETNQKDFLCFTLEDEKRKVKVYGETRIPKGTYQIEYRKEGGYHNKYSKRFPSIHRGMLEIRDVPNFTHILLHCGNTDDDTDGCLLVGNVVSQNITKDGFLGQSTDCYKRIYPILADILDTQKHLSIKIINFEEI